jgi:hypothetical protein
MESVADSIWVTGIWTGIVLGAVGEKCYQKGEERRRKITLWTPSRLLRSPSRKRVSLSQKIALVDVQRMC